MAFRISSVRTGPGFARSAAALLALVASPAAAQSTETTTKDQFVHAVFTRFDSNKDGTITNAEFMKVGEQDFQMLDANKDGSVSKDEFFDPKARHLDKLSAEDLAQAKTMWARQFDALDTDKNGQLSEAEHQRAGKRSFARMDANKDGKITLPEMNAAAQPQ
jgi:Ca2+-binding EF-hand superfamily protein